MWRIIVLSVGHVYNHKKIWFDSKGYIEIFYVGKGFARSCKAYQYAIWTNHHGKEDNEIDILW